MTTPSTAANALPTGTWSVDPGQTSVTVTVKNFGVKTVDSTLDVMSGAVNVDEQGSVSDINVSLSAASFSTGNAKRDEHVRSDDFLAAETHPTITFSAGSARATAGGYEVPGQITLKGQSTPVTLSVNNVKIDGGKATFAASGAVSRKDLGVDKMPSFIIGSSLKIALSVSCTLS